jgi:cellulose synthase/poly-beta-1,6-N-acetylglucosamine synthase-like glycosyltransferase
MSGDGVFTYRDGIAAAQIIAFSLPLLFALYFKYTGRIGWFCIGVFSCLRIVGASCKLAALNNNSRGLSAAVFVCESLGMVLIIFLLLEMLERT